MGYGMKGHLLISAQQSFGTATNSWDSVPIISESLTTNIEELIEEGMRGRFEESPSHEGLLTVAGDIVFEPHPVMLGHFLRGVTGQASSTAQDSSFLWEFLPAANDFTPGVCAVPPFTLQVFRDVGSAYQLTDAIINALTIEVAGGAIKRATAGVLARISSLMDPGTPSYETGKPWTWDASSISIAGAANSDFENYAITFENNIEGVTLLNATKLHAKYMRNDHRRFGVSGGVCFINQAEYNQFRAVAEQRFLVTVTGAETIATSYFNVLTMDLPLVRYKTYEAGIGGPGRLTATFEGNAKYDTTSSYGIRATLVNTRATYGN